MRVELCQRSGNIFLHSENDKDKAEIYAFWVENEKYKKNFRMEPVWTEEESREAGYKDSEAHVTLHLTCEAE